MVWNTIAAQDASSAGTGTSCETLRDLESAYICYGKNELLHQR